MFLRIPFNVLNGIIEEKKRDFLLSFLPQKIKFKRKKIDFLFSLPEKARNY